MYGPDVPAVDSEQYWDERARENALFFVDSRVDYEDPDAEDFWRRGGIILDKMLDMVGHAIAPGETVADIGCGVGRLTRVLAGRATKVYGIDVSGEMLALAGRHNADLRNVEWLHGDGKGLGVLPDASVDGCLSHVVFQHIPDPDVTLNYVREMGRVLRPGGWALFQVSTDPGVHRGTAGRRARVKALLRRRVDDPHRAWWGSAVKIRALKGAAKDGGLDVEQVLGEGSQYTTVFARRA